MSSRIPVWDSLKNSSWGITVGIVPRVYAGVPSEIPLRFLQGKLEEISSEISPVIPSVIFPSLLQDFIQRLYSEIPPRIPVILVIYPRILREGPSEIHLRIHSGNFPVIALFVFKGQPQWILLEISARMYIKTPPEIPSNICSEVSPEIHPGMPLGNATGFSLNILWIL